MVRRLKQPGQVDFPNDNQAFPQRYDFDQIALTGDSLAVGMSNATVTTTEIPPVTYEVQGQVAVFCRNTGGTNNWGLEQILNSPDNGETDRFGASIAADDQILAIGMGQWRHTGVGAEPTGTGAVAIYRRTGTDDNPWVFSHKITPPGGVLGDFFGDKLALDGELLAVLDFNADSQKLYLFERNKGGGSQWDMVQRMKIGAKAKGLALDSGRVAYQQEGFNGNATMTWITVHERNSGGPDGWRPVWTSPEVETGSLSSVNYDGFVALQGEHLFAGRRFGLANFDTVETFRLPRTPYETWLRAQFTDAVVDSGSQQNTVWGELADPDKDGWPNLMEAAFGTDPQSAGASPHVSLAIRSSIGSLQAPKFVWRWHRAAEDQGIQLRPQWSPNLQQWYSSGDGPPGDARTITVTDLGPDGTGRHLMEATLSASSAAGFLRFQGWRQ